MPPALISADQVSRTFPTGPCVALSGVTLSIGKGEYVAVTGPSGSGKSTLLHLLSGIDQPTTGRILFDGLEPASRREWAALRATRIGFVFQSFHLLPTLTAAQNVQIPMFGVVAAANERRERASALLASVGLGARLGHRPNELSGGERQRLAIARSLANAPDILMADEPTGNLDSKTSTEILDLLEEIHRRERTALVVVTHDHQVARRAGRTVEIEDGRIARDVAAGGKA